MYKSGFLLIDSDAQSHDWAGTLWGSCEDCQDLKGRPFKKAVMTAWKTRAEACGERFIRLQKRSSTMADALAWIEEKYPGVGAAKRRELALLRIQAFLLAFVSALASVTEQTRVAYQTVHQRYVDACAKAAQDPGAPGPASAGLKLGRQADWLTEVAIGIAVSFACRFVDCRWYGMNHQWIADPLEGHFRCPMCKREYQPWTQSRGQLAYQKAVHIASPGGQVYAFPVKWPGSQADSFLLQCCEVYAANLKTDKDLEAFCTDAAWNLEQTLKKVGIAEGMRHFPWDNSTEYMLSAKWPKDGPLGWGRLTQGFHGNVVPLPADGNWDTHVFADWDELVAVLGSCIYAGKQLAARL